MLDSLRQPLESGVIVLHRTGGAVSYPARFQLVMATNPCPCGASKDTDCSCTPDARRRYRRRLSGPLLDRIDLQIPIDPVSRADLLADQDAREPSAAVAGRVAAARAAARAPVGRRSAGAPTPRCPGRCCARAAWRPPRQALARLDAEIDRGGLSARGCDRVLRLSWTLADLAGLDSPGSAEVSEAIWLRTGRAAVMSA